MEEAGGGGLEGVSFAQWKKMKYMLFQLCGKFLLLFSSVKICGLRLQPIMLPYRTAVGILRTLEGSDFFRSGQQYAMFPWVIP